MSNRLQNKCFIAATSVHLLLMLILLVGPAFLASSSKPDNTPVLDIIPFTSIEQAFAPSGGNPNAGQAPPPIEHPRQPAPQNPVEPPKTSPEPPKLVKKEEPIVDPPKETPKQKVPDETSEEPAQSKKQPPKVKVNLAVVDRSKVQPPNSKTPSTEMQEKAEARERERIASAVRDAAKGIRSGSSKSTEIDIPLGTGGGGEYYANFLQAVKSLYANAWTVPDGVTDDEATTAVAITILRDGTVREAHITRSSGNDKVDQSVQALLNRIRFAVPLPKDSKQSERTVKLKFNVKAKLLG